MVLNIYILKKDNKTFQNIKKILLYTPMTRSNWFFFFIGSIIFWFSKCIMMLHIPFYFLLPILINILNFFFNPL